MNWERFAEVPMGQLVQGNDDRLYRRKMSADNYPAGCITDKKAPFREVKE